LLVGLLKLEQIHLDLFHLFTTLYVLLLRANKFKKNKFFRLQR